MVSDTERIGIREPSALMEKVDLFMDKDIIFQELKSEDAQQAKELCLRNIKDTFGDEYHPRWAYDLDTLAKPDSLYRNSTQGIFLVAKLGQILLGTIGIRSLLSHEHSVPPRVLSTFHSLNSVAYITRAYVEPKYRSHGIGTHLVHLSELFARKYYSIIYLHTHPNVNYDSIIFWTRRKYSIILEEYGNDPTIHMSKVISTHASL